MKNKNEVLKLLLILAYSDKDYHEKEEIMINQMSKEHDLPIDKINEYSNEIKNTDESFVDMCVKTIEKIKDADTREKTLTMLARLAVADFIVHEDEIVTLELISDQWGMYVSSLRNYNN